MIKRILILCTVLLIGSACVSFKGGFHDPGEPASVSKFNIHTLSNDMGLVKHHSTELSSECGLSENDFIKYVRDRVDYSQIFLFIVFEEGKPLVGDTCYKKAHIYYLKEQKADAVKEEM